MTTCRGLQASLAHVCSCLLSLYLLSPALPITCTFFWPLLTRSHYSIAISTVLWHLVLNDHSFPPQLRLQWRTQRRAPRGMFRGSAVAEQNTVYCISRGSNTVYCYEVNKDKWQKHSECPHSNTGLAIIRGVLTAIGGLGRSGETNKLLSWKNQVWEEVFPPMSTARYDHAVVGYSGYVIAAGGNGETSVELFDISCSTWSTVASLPRPLLGITATVCGDRLYVMDLFGETYYTSISNFKEAPTQPSHLQPTWLPLPDAPVRGSTLSTMCGAVVAVGGVRGATATSDIHQVHSGEWVRIGCMDTAREWPIVAALPTMVVVGGYPSSPSSFTAVELAVLC